MRHTWMRAVLIARCVSIVGFVGWMSATPPTFGRLLIPFGWFAAVDGVLSLAMAMLALGIPVIRGGFAIVALLDGLWLVATAGILFLGPGIPDFALTLVLYLSLAAVCALFVGLLKISGARKLNKTSDSHALSTAMYIAGIASAACGVGLIFMRPSPELLRYLLMTAAAIEGMALLAVALRDWPAVEGSSVSSR